MGFRLKAILAIHLKIFTQSILIVLGASVNTTKILSGIIPNFVVIYHNCLRKTAGQREMREPVQRCFDQV
jgi:hypothetical protein